MEQGSLLEQALQKTTQQLSEDEDSRNILLLDIYLLSHHQDEMQHLLHLAKLAKLCNAYLQTHHKFHWHYGGDGPVFGVHVGDEGISHLRAYCRYGPSVTDEWAAIEMIMALSKHLEDNNHKVAITCWDVQDGQVILIQTAEVLPEWLDQDPTDNHRYSCWIRGGTIQLLPQPHISLADALNYLRNQDEALSSLEPSHPKVQNTLQHFLQRNREFAFAQQRTPLVVPRKVAALIRNRPDLVHAAIQAFCDHMDDPCPNLLDYDDWVWTTVSLSRTNYAMLRTMVSSEWKTAEFTPPVGVEVKRFKRQCQMEATPHLRRAVSLGVRLVAGVEFLTKTTKWDIIPVDQRIMYWTRIEQDGQRGAATESVILASYQQGPNHAQYDLTELLKCPVFPEEAGNSTLDTHPETSIQQQIANAQKSADSNETFPIPLADQVDEEAWMILDDGNSRGVEGTSDLDRILSRFQNFMVQPAEVEGVVTTTAIATKSRRDIRPRVFMNLLHAVLKNEPISFPNAEDPFFYKEDYDLMDDYDDESGGDDEDDAGSGGMHGLMDAMDSELELTSKSREYDGVAEAGDTTSIPKSQQHRQIAENAHVLNNLLQSLEASAGDTGPVPNMLKGMGSEAPKNI